MIHLIQRTVHTSFVGLLIIGPLLLTGCGSEPAEDSTATNAGNAAAVADEYPLTTCVVSGEKLGSMGDPVVMEHDGVTVKLCCKSCVAKFKENPAKFATMVTEGVDDRGGHDSDSHEGHDH